MKKKGGSLVEHLSAVISGSKAQFNYNWITVEFDYIIVTKMLILVRP